jgi:Cu(I)/Ag(I) efflux system protein CusF
MMRKFLAVVLAAMLMASGAWASSHQASALFDGEVRKVDKDAKKITIKHGPMQSLDMPPMTMVFQVKDPALLDQVKAGDKVKFQAEKLGGAFTVTRIEPVR